MIEGEGFRPQGTRITLEFEESDLQGLKVLTRSVPLEKFLDMLRASSDSSQTAQLIQDFGERALIDWNLLDPESGEPVPPTFEGMKTQDTNLMLRIVRAWTANVASPPAPLGDGSSNGSDLPAEAIPMAPL